MMLIHRFVEHIPDCLEEGVIYISIDFCTAIHLCACGCKKEVVTPISPDGWALTFNGKSISLFPSIGNWSFPCQSHYWIKQGDIVWVPQWTQATEEVETVIENAVDDENSPGVGSFIAAVNKLKTFSVFKRPFKGKKKSKGRGKG